MFSDSTTKPQAPVPPSSGEEGGPIGREIRLAARPTGEPGPENFELVRSTVPALRHNQILVRNTWMSVDPYMRGRMDDRKSYISPFRLGAVLEGGAIGEVVSSQVEGISVGATVSHFLGWREYAVLDGADATVVDTTIAPAEAYLGVLGTPGLTAYVALTDTAPVRPGDVVFVSAAAGAVGTVAGQLARKLGASRVIGSAGGPEKARRLVDDFGFDAGIDYRAGSVASQLAAVAPGGIDVYLDNVGGDHLAAALGALHVGGRVALVGAISTYNATAPVPGPANLSLAVGKRLTLRGMLVTDHLERLTEYIALAAGWLTDGTLCAETTVLEGIEQAPAAFLGMLRGANTGKMLVRLGD
ncbi:NADP-dependent oxidoreductase [Plantactinospora sp. S1510]|uniref:NADP-dependent oxidoreductase n=1 Tax=Plantactinospora alkalitolerans TaxID=2789879 RepID=A0ABS0H569_9ACTN|nr:NADP-dependent oxidoreductase [Plantactinospora alkalitolerans]MBF9133603.1 NADP-dependent oxidoreductase [Plantactinospora alkalitolerans]